MATRLGTSVAGSSAPQMTMCSMTNILSRPRPPFRRTPYPANPPSSTPIKHLIGLVVPLIAQEHNLRAPIFHLGDVQLGLPDMANAPERPTDTPDFLQNQASNDVMPFKLFEGTRLRMNTAMLTTSP